MIQQSIFWMKDVSFFIEFCTLYILQVTTLQTQLKEKTDRCDSLSKQLSVTASLSEERAASIDSLRQELDHLRLAKVALICDSSTAVLRT